MGSLLPPGAIRHLSGFGRALSSDGYLFQPSSVEELLQSIQIARTAGRKVVLRGAARSYGDAANGSEDVILDLTGMNKILHWDPVTGVIEVEPGVTLADMWRTTLPDGWWLPVVSGTTKPTIAGALAMNIHGKNNFMRGTLGEHVLELDFTLATGETKRLRPQDELFYGVISGAGLLGVITGAKLQMKKVSSGNVKVEAFSCSNWEDQFDVFERFEGKAEYVVSWIDCFARGEACGRGIIHVANYVEDDADSLQLSAQDLPAKIMGVVPKSAVWRILKLLNHRPGMRLVNAAKYFTGKMFEHNKAHIQSIAKYNFLLDYVPGWEKSYLPGGLIQCQYFVPRQHAKNVFRTLVEMQQEAKLESYLAVMKRHRPDKFLLSHAVDGYSLAFDFKVTAANKQTLWDLARRMNDFALQNRARFYFAKDSTLTPEQTEAFLGPTLNHLKELKALYDPEGLFTSDLAKRVGLV